MTLEFTPGPPKKASAATLAELKRAVGKGNKIQGAKPVGDDVIKVFMSGQTNYYLKSTDNLRSFLESKGIAY